MIFNFAEEFEYEVNGNIYQVEVVGSRETDIDGRMYSELNKLIVIDDLGNELDDYDDVYNEIQEYVLYDKQYEIEDHGFSSEWADEEEFPEFGRN